MKIKTIFCHLFMAVALLPTMLSCSEADSSSPFGSLPKVYGEYAEAGAKLKEEAKDIKTEEDKTKYLKKYEKLTKKWSEKLGKSAEKLDGKPIEFAEGQIAITQPVSFQFKNVLEKSQLYPIFTFNGSAETAEEIVLDRTFYLPSVKVNMVGYDSEGQEQFVQGVGSVDVQEVDGKSVVVKGTPVKFDSFQFGTYALEKYVNTTVLKLEVANL